MDSDDEYTSEIIHSDGNEFYNTTKDSIIESNGKKFWVRFTQTKIKSNPPNEISLEEGSDNEATSLQPLSPTSNEAIISKQESQISHLMGYIEQILK
ncbi:5469_t:CDS:2 [Gigaspora margarita]|uniref:5469_t:CDS:1 n=1 Tax=Gigaspora margarita TaxID=4874 RepID=A0ABN7UHR9_GIGMA|nr:5469_t:CDS:2 [Gigaspora margarita]